MSRKALLAKDDLFTKTPYVVFAKDEAYEI
jgi:hypothetical protein